MYTLPFRGDITCACKLLTVSVFSWSLRSWCSSSRPCTCTSRSSNSIACCLNSITFSYIVEITTYAAYLIKSHYTSRSLTFKLSIFCSVSALTNTRSSNRSFTIVLALAKSFSAIALLACKRSHESSILHSYCSYKNGIIWLL